MVEVAPITTADVSDVAEFLHRSGDVVDLSAEVWERSMKPTWEVDQPNHGFMLVADEGVVGVYVALYADRRIDGHTQRFCNLCAWVVLPEYRLHSLRLLKALLAQEGFTFTDFSPIPQVQKLNSRFGFELLDTTMAMTINLPWPSLPGRGHISSDPAFIREQLSGADLLTYRDHEETMAALQFVMVRGDETCHVILRRQLFKKLKCASILHVSNPHLYRSMARQLGHHLLRHFKITATLAELRMVEERPRISLVIPGHPQKMFRSSTLRADQIDYLYSELVCLQW